MGKVWLDQINCTGLERNITECGHLPWGEGSCGHLEDAGVKCHAPYSPPVDTVRVIGGPNEMEGRVEVMHQVKELKVTKNERKETKNTRITRIKIEENHHKKILIFSLTQGQGFFSRATYPKV